MNTNSKKLSPASRNKKFSPEKKANELSQLTPVQLFQKRFGELEVHFHELKKYSPPNGSEQFFQVFINFKSNIPSFALHASKILKQRTLSAPLNLKSFESCRVFKDELPIFIQRITSFQTKIRKLYYKSIFNYFNVMIQNFDEFSEICKQEPHTRSVFLQYEESCRNTIQKIEFSLQSVFDLQKFQTISTDESNEISENIKTFGRFYLFDMQRILSPYILSSQTKYSPKYYSQFKSAFEELVPMLSAIPSFRDEYSILLTKIPPMQESFDHLYRLLGDTPDAIKLKTKPKLTGEQPSLFIEPVDPIEKPLENMSKALNIQFDENEKDNAVKIEKVTKQVKETIESLKNELERVKKRLLVLEPMKSKDAIIDRFEQIRAFKNEFTKQEEKVRNDFMRNLIYQFKDLAKDVKIDLNDNYHTQIKDILDAISKDLGQKEAEISGLKDQINETKGILSQMSNQDVGDLSQVNLSKLVHESISKYRSIQKETVETHSKITNFLKENFENQDSDFAAFNTDESLQFIKKSLDSQKREINELKEKFDKKEKSKDSLKKETKDVLTLIHSSLDKMIDSSSNISSNPPEKLTELRDEVKSKLKVLQDKQKENREKFSNFFIKVTSVLNLPPVDFSSGDIDDSYEKAMTEIADKLTIPTKTDLMLKSESNEEFKDFVCDLCVRITQKPKDEFKQIELNKLKETVFSNLETLISEKVDLSKLDKFLPKHDQMEAMDVISSQLSIAKKISDFSSKMSQISEPSEICEALKSFIKGNDEADSDFLNALRKIADLIDLSQTQMEVVELKRQIENFKKFIANKDNEIQEITEKMRNCQKHFFEYVDAIKKQTEDNQELLQKNAESGNPIVDFFSNFDQNDDF